MRRLVIIICILFFAVIAASVLYFTRLEDSSSSNTRMLHYVPADAAFLISFQNEKSFYTIFRDFEIFEAIIGSKGQHQLQFLQNELLKGSEFTALSKQQTVYFSFHPRKDSINWLLTFPFNEELSDDQSTRQLQNALKGKGEARKDPSVKETVYEIRLTELKTTPFYIAFKPGGAFLSFDRTLVYQAVNEQAAHLSPAFIEEWKANGSKNNSAILNLHLNHTRLSSLISTLIRSKPGNNLQLLDGLKGMSSLNMNFQSDALMFSGLTNIEENHDTYLALYANQHAVEEELKAVLPSNTAAYASFAFSDYRSFHQQLCRLLEKRKQLSGMQQQIKLINQSKKVDIDSSLLNQWDSEFASIELNTRESIGIVKVKDSTAFSETIDQLSTGAAEHVRRLDNSNLLYYSFGDPMLLFKRPYFTMVNNYLICANTISTLQQFRNNYYSQRLLVNNPDFLDFNKLRANKANVSFFIHNQNISRYINRILKPVFYQSYRDTTHFRYHDLYAFSFQLAGYDGKFYSNLSAKFNFRKEAERKPEWTYNLSGTISYPPKVLRFNDSLPFILTQDKANRLYAISEEGREWWRTSLSGQILGDIYQLADKSILLNTDEKLYWFLPDGTPLSGFPVLLPHRATAGLTLFGNDPQELKIFIPAENRILAYDRHGKILDDWKDKSVDGRILYELKTALLDGYNYVIAETDRGKFYLYNYNGSLVKILGNTENNTFKNNFGIRIIPGDPSRSRILTTDTTGTLLSFYFDNKQSKTSLGSWTPNHYFNMINIQQDSLPELIYTDKNQLYVYGERDSVLLFHHKFDSEIRSPVFFPTESGQYVIGIPSAARLLYVFDSEGSVIKGFPMTGLSPFYYGKIRNDGHRYVLLSQDGLTLAAYQLE